MFHSKLPHKDKWKHYHPYELFKMGANISSLKTYFGFDDEELIKSEGMAETLTEFGQAFIASINMEDIANELPIIKNIMFKLHLIRYVLENLKLSSINVEAYLAYEEVDNAIKKAKINLTSEWMEEEDKAFVIEEDIILQVADIYYMVSLKPRDLVKLAQSLSVKITTKPENVKALPNDVIDKEKHIRECAKLNLDPYKTTAKELQTENEKDKLRELYISKQITKEEYDERRAMV